MEEDNFIYPFKTCIYKSKIKNPLLKNTFLSILENQKKIKQSNSVSNVGGYQSSNLNEKMDVLIETTKEHIKKFIIHLIPTKNFKANLNFYWLNENNKNDFNKIHHHCPNTNFSLIWYLKANGKGKINFLNGDMGATMNGNDHFFKHSFKNFYSLEPITDDLLVFPSHLNHFVEPSFDDSSRVSLATNIFLV
jgi:uncharacterized protein (TIGR02466 family)